MLTRTAFRIGLCGAFFLMTFGGPVRGDIVLSFDGEPFIEVFGAPTLTTADRITGTITFDDFGPLSAPTTLAAKSFMLSLTVDGAPGFSFNVTDAATDSRVELNEFDFTPGSLKPSGFILTVTGDVFGDAGFEEGISISEIGDLASIDIDSGGGSESLAFNESPGTITAVPEPSASLFVSAGIFMLIGRRSRISVRWRRFAIPAAQAPGGSQEPIRAT
ncbi:hypothetical protein [Crateriforma spongiae]|uniref:hypothetical protein n=1 Tax=Crateriforma spongiae TaxID=2724528 RepID=UPI0039B10E9E